MRLLASVLFATAAAHGACASLTAEHAVTGTPRSPFSGDVKVVMEGAPLPEAVDEIAIVTASGAGPDAKLPVIVNKLRAEAASVGANAVIRVRYDIGASRATATGVAVWIR